MTTFVVPKTQGRQMIMNRIVRGALIGVLTLGVTMGGAQAASAATLFDHNNYGGDHYGPFTWATTVGGLNDRASSVKNGGYTTYFEDTYYGGRNVALTGDYNSLGAVSINLHWGETWSDRISSFG